ncbi:glycosyltransferase family 2 protein [Clostridium botulinum]|uniref:Glycosyltransferase n=2 Tax=Clostridium botulinum TaxID=1491 RepID=A0A0A2HF67_CLOBO|nr:glycosyltransferase family 2 protein [Clostridium botulinum]AJD26497.1 glycosyl transferase 2 family protein [Clostridium botulinum CDC_297]ACQ52803.1 glycosyl transferase, group 2 family [Clostridium botulinum Ba4 str. 657]AJE10706.1 glycosyl transferase 2 family protein [Clostridium botulinum CDC_1436]APQ99148.1 glycosyl transferase 21 family protein [Clostridium botulinum]APU61478.1 glycosyl transferase 21 family protein [Clostridium botulinum]
MNIINGIVHYSSKAITYIVYFISMYYLIISLFGIYRKKNNKNIGDKTKFALIVAAHNEELVIGNIIESLKMMDYDKKLYDIFVIADNCTDKTAEIARKKGAIVRERFDKKRRGKGYALEWMFNIIFKMEKKYDAIAVFDADNLVHKNFLKEMNKKMCKGYKVVQGYLDSKNPEDTWVTGSYSIAFWSCNRMFQLARYNLGLSSQLGGTGFCIDTDILKELGWGATCLTEDLEFSCKIILNGYKVGWAHDAIIYDEKPLTLAQSWRQRKRWMQGFADVSSRYFFKLMKKAIKSFNFTAFDCALYSIQPFVAILLGLSAIISLFQYVIKATNIVNNFNNIVYSIDFNLITILIILFSLFQILYTPLILILEKKFTFKVLLYYIVYPIYAITWFPISIQGIMDKNNKEWSHTIHTRSMNIDELEKVN